MKQEMGMRGWVSGVGVATAAVCAISFALAGRSFAGEAEVRVEVQAIVPPLQRLEVDPLIFVAPEIRPEDLAIGYAELPEPVVLVISSNVPWSLSVRWADDQKIVDAGGPGNSSLLDWSVRNAPFRPATAEWATVARDQQPAAAERVELHLRVPLLAGAPPPGIYQPRLEYRLAPAEE
jgi:hypothetical protein